jgi:hypothetical protein
MPQPCPRHGRISVFSTCMLFLRFRAPRRGGAYPQARPPTRPSNALTSLDAAGFFSSGSVSESRHPVDTLTRHRVP